MIPIMIFSLFPQNGYGRTLEIIMVQEYTACLFLTIHLKFISNRHPGLHQSKLLAWIRQEYRYDFTNRLIASGDSDEGYVFAAPYSDHGWLTGTVPVNQDDFILKGSIADPPLLIAVLLNEKLKAAGIKISKKPSTLRLEKTEAADNLKKISEIKLSSSVRNY